MNDDENSSAIDDIAEEDAAKNRILKFKERQARLKSQPKASEPEGKTAMSRGPWKKKVKKEPELGEPGFKGGYVENLKVPKKRGPKPKKSQPENGVTLEAVEEALESCAMLLRIYKGQREERMKALVAAL